MANELDVPQLTEGQASPEVTANDASARVANAISDIMTVDLTSGNVSVTATEYRTSMFFNCSGVATSGRTVTLPLVKRALVIFECPAANTNTISLIRGSTTLTLSPGRTYAVRTDGTANGLVARDVGGTSEPLDLSIFLPGIMTDAQLLFARKTVRAFTLPINLTGSYGTAQVSATASTTVTLKKNGSSIGTMVWAIAGTVATITFSSAVSFAVGDLLTAHGPATADATLADVSLDLLGSR